MVPLKNSPTTGDSPAKGGPAKSGPAKSGPAKSGPVKGGPVKGGPVKGSPEARWSGDPSEQHPEQWLREHSADLITHLQGWAESLSAREAQLNAQTALLEHRERQFRVWRRDRSEQIAESQQRIDRLRTQIEAQARRLAFRDQ